MLLAAGSSDGRTPEERTQKRNDKKRMQRQRRAERHLLETSDAVSASFTNDTSALAMPSTKNYPQPRRMRRLLRNAILDVDNFLSSLDPATQQFIAANDIDGTWVEVLSLALNHGIRDGRNLGWERGRAPGEKEQGRREDIAVGRPEVKSPPPVLQQFREAEIEPTTTHTVASTIFVPQEPNANVQELIDAIISSLDDTDTLKTCSLVSSRFRGARQRTLHSSLTLNEHQDSTSALDWRNRLTSLHTFDA
jgi:hypothetical protein